MRALFVFFILMCLSISALAAAPTPAQLQKLKRQISTLQQSIETTSDKRSAVDASLKKLDIRISKLSKQQQQLSREQAKTRQAHRQLKAKQKTLINHKQRQLSALIELIRQNYSTGQTASLTLLLNQKRPDRIARLLEYQRYIGEARNARIQALNNSLSGLEELSEQLLANKKKQQQQKQLLAKKSASVKNARQERQQLLANLDEQIDSKKTRLKKLEANRQHLQKLLRGLQDSISDIPVNLGDKPFSSLAHKLPWPLTGSIAVRFRSIRGGSVRWDGVVLDAQRGEPVRAVYPGRVIYADWLSGYGLMIIIDQGKGYMTLYGFNENLTRDVGDWVSAGDIIAHAGNSGGRRQPGLYFGIRHRGKAVNPQHWCSRRVRLPSH